MRHPREAQKAACTFRLSRCTSVLSNLGSVYTQLGRYEEAEPLFRRCLAIAEKMERPSPTANTKILQSLRNVYLQQGRVGDAEAIAARIRKLND